MIKILVIRKESTEAEQQSTANFLNGEIENALKRVTQSLILRNTVM